jgi:hypothetical protein
MFADLGSGCASPWELFNKRRKKGKQDMTWNLMGSLGTDGKTTPVVWRGVGDAIGNFAAFGVFNGGAATLEMSLDDGATYFFIDDTLIDNPAAGGVKTFVLIGGDVMNIEKKCLIRGSLDGSAGGVVNFMIGTQDQR